MVEYFFCSGHVIATSNAAGLPPNNCGTKTSAGLRWSVNKLGFSLTGSRWAFEASTKIISLILLCLEAISPLCVHLTVWPALGDRVSHIVYKTFQHFITFPQASI